ncbi:MAG: zinc-binding dehydrogenase [Candidatus Latescibacteria bacterium]|jgi:threonine dehydrogenase-like Zn-dependent dehydrogenase|nr:zinc-binding dehydrogenase [Candidatus Latescibacterota bacterium]
MLRFAKPEGKYNLILEEAPIPEPGPGEVRVKAVRSLISRGSEMGARYTREHAVSPNIMGYSLAGTVDALGEGISHLKVGDRVVAVAPHAQYVVRSALIPTPKDQAWVTPIADDVSFEQAPFHPLCCGAVTWVGVEDIQDNHTVVILGQGLVGSLMLQVVKASSNVRVVAVDALDSRCAMAESMGADVVINAASEDPVQAVRKLTSGIGADIVIYAVGGPAGPKAFEQGLDMLAVDGLLHLIGLHEDEPLPLMSGKIQRRKLIGGYYGATIGARQSRRAMDLLANGAIDTEAMTTHRFPFTQGPEAFDLLYNRPNDAFGVLFEWD